MYVVVRPQQISILIAIQILNRSEYMHLFILRICSVNYKVGLEEFKTTICVNSNSKLQFEAKLCRRTMVKCNRSLPVRKKSLVSYNYDSYMK